MPAWLAAQSNRRIRTSGRSCSAACVVFFARDLVAHEEALHGAVAEALRDCREFCV